MTKISKDKLEAAKAEAELLQSNSEDDITEVRPGRPKKVDTKIVRTNLDIPVGMLSELDKISKSLNISRQALMKTWLLDQLNSHYQAQYARKQVETV